ncbi:S41 family peptidase [Streptomyces sp. NPDC050504]|uniref:S41 family peptidase n=1 Tax=Streptomyces sp. NPDC050504 TaxID=3365618 RepID=UPI0037AD325E
MAGRKRRTARAAVAGLALAVAGTLAAPGTTPAAARSGDRLDGAWRMDGYSTIVTIGGGKLAMYDTTRGSCVRGYTSADQVGAPGPGGATRFEAGADGTFTIVPRPHGHARMQVEESVGVRHLKRLAALPEQCGRAASQAPLAVFDRFWETFADNYPFFAAKGIDWQAVRDRYRARVTPGTTDAQLQRMFTAMIRPLHDSHTALAYDGRLVHSGLRPGTREATDELRERTGRAIARQLVEPPRLFGEGRLAVGELPGRIGYFRVDSFGGYVKDGTFRQELAELDRALDALLDGRTGPGADPARALRGLVIDVRLNGGGYDVLGLRIAARLTDRAYTAYTKVARNDPLDPTRYTRPQPITVGPADASRWTGGVALLTSGSSESAAETFTQAMIGRSPKATRIGENTQGVFSDIMIRAVSEKWTAVVPNEKYLDRDGRTFDGPGIPPHLRTPVFTEKELDGGRDSALTRARQVLGGKPGRS